MKYTSYRWISNLKTPKKIDESYDLKLSLKEQIELASLTDSDK